MRELTTEELRLVSGGNITGGAATNLVGFGGAGGTGGVGGGAPGGAGGAGGIGLAAYYSPVYVNAYGGDAFVD
jgi:hypothetical protein